MKEEQSFQGYTVRIYATPGMGAIEILKEGIGSQFRHIGTILPGDYAPIVADLDADGSLEFTVHDHCFRFYHGGNRRSGSYVDPLITFRHGSG